MRIHINAVAHGHGRSVCFTFENWFYPCSRPVGVKFHANYILTMPNFHIENNSLWPPHTTATATRLRSIFKSKCDVKFRNGPKGNRKKAVRKFIYYSHERYFFLLVLVRLRRWSMTKKRRAKEKKHSIFLGCFFEFSISFISWNFRASCNAIGRVLNWCCDIVVDLWLLLLLLLLLFHFDDFMRLPHVAWHAWAQMVFSLSLPLSFSSIFNVARPEATQFQISNFCYFDSSIIRLKC